MKILLLGNGFDIFHKLPTKYQNFLHTVNFLKKEYNSSMNNTGDVFSNKKLMDKEISESYERYKKHYDQIPIDSEKINKLISLSQNNMWYSYLNNSFNEDLKWIDFEREIAKVLYEIGKFFDIHKSANNKRVISIPLSDEFSKTRYIIQCFSFFNHEHRNGANINYYYRSVDPQYVIEEPYGSQIYDIDKEKIIDEMYKQLRELAEMLKLYLECFIESLIDALKNDDTIVPGMSVYDATHVVTLNYTSTFEKLYGDKNIFHIHGNIHNDIVLGINSDENDELHNLNTDFLCFKKYYQRVFYKTDIDYQKFNISINKYINSPYQKDDSVYVIGHSLDETDTEIIQKVFDRVNKIIIFYHKDSAIKDYVRNLIRIYGKKGFDSLRTEKNLEFKSLTEIMVKK